MSEHDDRIKRVKDALEDDESGFSAVVLAGAYAEYYIERLIRSRFVPERATAFFPDNRLKHIVPFATLVRLADSLGLLPPGYPTFLMALASLRNNFAHNINYVITINDAKHVFRALVAKFVGPEDAPAADVMRILDQEIYTTVQDYLWTILDDMLNTLDMLCAENVDPHRLAELKEREATRWTEFARDVGVRLSAAFEANNQGA